MVVVAVVVAVVVVAVVVADAKTCNSCRNHSGSILHKLKQRSLLCNSPICVEPAIFYFSNSS